MKNRSSTAIFLYYTPLWPKAREYPIAAFWTENHKSQKVAVWLLRFPSVPHWRVNLIKELPLIMGKAIDWKPKAFNFFSFPSCVQKTAQQQSVAGQCQRATFFPTYDALPREALPHTWVWLQKVAQESSWARAAARCPRAAQGVCSVCWKVENRMTTTASHPTDASSSDFLLTGRGRWTKASSPVKPSCPITVKGLWNKHL